MSTRSAQNASASEDEIEEPWNFSWITQDVLAAMSCPYKKSHILFLKSVGIKHLVTLSPDTRPYHQTDNGIQYHEIAIEEFEPPTTDQIKTFISLCENAKNKKEPVGVHCRMGRGRTGVMVACYLMYFFSLTPDRALTNVRLQRPGSVETFTQERILFTYYDYLRTMTK
ncbi:dual specificity protein phosphatase 23-like [Agrilus planipennis]|uniref:Dual specificity protein phosphatase 23 n=1 Tax=Agrilus planipennis TaxID=224129 RepID=A0A1W4WI89_AGRPL|nr:dual specificity protein phosphatase 23-like [Agrilus planipennis]